jgi:hypothetical protein
VTAGDATQTARDIVASLGLFRLGIVSLTLVTALDVVIACALYRVFSPVHKNLCTLRWPCDWSTRPSPWSQQVASCTALVNRLLPSAGAFMALLTEVPYSGQIPFAGPPGRTR